jgi:hypothetical protein
MLYIEGSAAQQTYGKKTGNVKLLVGNEYKPQVEGGLVPDFLFFFYV